MIGVRPDLRGIGLKVNFEKEVRRLIDFDFSEDELMMKESSGEEVRGLTTEGVGEGFRLDEVRYEGGVTDGARVHRNGVSFLILLMRDDLFLKIKEGERGSERGGRLELRKKRVEEL